MPFRSKLELMTAQIRTFKPLAGTRPPVLLDSWSRAKCLWQAARDRNFRSPTGRQSNRCLRGAAEGAPRGGRGQSVSDSAASWRAAPDQPVTWPRQGEEQRQGGGHLVAPRGRQLYRCQLIIVRERLAAPLKETRYVASRDLAADGAPLVGPLAARWRGAVRCADGQEVVGLDQEQVMRAQRLVHCWTLVWAASSYRDEARAAAGAVAAAWDPGGAARREVQGVQGGI